MATRYGGRTRLPQQVKDWLPAGEFNPLSLAPKAWFDASDTSTITESGGAVSQWDDKSGNGFHVSQGTAASQPTTGTQTLNGLNVLSFDGGDKLAASTASDWTFMLSGPSTVLLVVKKTANDGSFQPVLGMRREGTAERGLIFSVDTSVGICGADIYTTGGNGFLVDTRWRGLPKDYASAVIWATNPSASAVADETVIYVNNARNSRAQVGTGNTTTNAPAYPMNIGGLPTTHFFTGHIAEIVFYDFLFSQDQRIAATNYLNKKWGLL